MHYAKKAYQAVVVKSATTAAISIPDIRRGGTAVDLLEIAVLYQVGHVVSHLTSHRISHPHG